MMRLYLHLFKLVVWNATHNPEFPQSTLIDLFLLERDQRRVSLYFGGFEYCEIRDNIHYEMDGIEFYRETRRLATAQEIHDWHELKQQVIQSQLDDLAESVAQIKRAAFEISEPWDEGEIHA